MTRGAPGLVFVLGVSALALSSRAATPTPATADHGEAARVLEADRVATAGSATPAPGAVRIDYAFSGAGLTGKATSFWDSRDGRFVDTLDAGPASQTQGFDGARLWGKDASGAVTSENGGEQRALAINDSYRRANLWWRTDRGGAAIAALGVKSDPAGGAFDVLAVTPRGGKAFEAWFDTASHRLARIVEPQGAGTITTVYAEYRPAAGMMIPWRTTVDDGEGAKFVQTLTVIQARAEGPPAAAAFTAPQAVIADFALDGGTSRTVIPFQLINNHVYAEASVNGKGPFRFIFDTGGVNLVTPTLAKTLGLTVQGQFDAHGAGEGIMEAGLTRVESLKVGDARLKDQVFTVLPLDGMSDIEGVDEQGMVGFETFRRFITRIDYGAGTITLIDPKAFDPADAGTAIPFEFSAHDPEIAGAFEGVPGRFIIDTGSRAELTLNRPFAERIALRARHPKGIDAVDGWGVGGPSRAYVTRGAVFALGPVVVKSVVTSAGTQAKGAFGGDDSQGNIGGGLLKRFVVTFDYAHQILYLKPRTGPIADAGTFDRAGMWFNRAADGFKVADVTATGPAQAAGVKVGDVITAVDGQAVQGQGLHELRVRLRTAAPGTVLTLTLRRDGQALTTAVTLRDLI